MIRILSASISLEGMPNANGLLTIPGGVVQTRWRQDGGRRHRRQVHVGVRVVLHRRRVREIGSTRTSVAGTWTSMTLTRARIFRNRTRDYRDAEGCHKSHATSCAILYAIPMCGGDFFARSLARCLWCIAYNRDAKKMFSR